MTMYTVTLRSAGNPDHGEFFDQGVLSPTLEVECATVSECQEAAASYRVTYGLGGGNWVGGAVRKDGKLVGRIGYNGRFWPEQGGAA
jgi:hypothetical protein